jgi:hypothetical protein
VSARSNRQAQGTHHRCEEHQPTHLPDHGSPPALDNTHQPGGIYPAPAMPNTAPGQRVVPDIEAQGPELLRSAFIHGVKRMDCSFTPRA